MIRQVKLPNGIVRGIQAADPRITAFKGIPFAAPPVGDLRWKAPQPAKDWDGVLQAFDFAPISVQNTPGLSQTDIYTKEWNVDPEIPMSEDCLYLNVWTPAKKTDEKLPVYVWYFGGGLQVGNPAEMEFNGERIARRGIVVVTVNYRLNCFGFLAHPEITAENPDFPTNFGNLDQKFGTEWVKKNIELFGGDPNNITIGGQSAGGGSVLTQLTSPLNEGLFQKAVVISGIMVGAYANRFGRTSDLKSAEQDGVKFFDFLGVKTLAEARALDAMYIRDKAREYRGFWVTVNDGNYIVGNNMERMLKNKRLMVPLFMGNTTDEFMAVPDAKTDDDLRTIAQNTFGADADRFLELVKADTVEKSVENATFSPIELGARSVFKHTAATDPTLKNFYYKFDVDIPGPDNPGTFHSVDLWFFFETLGVCWRPYVGRHYDIARQMCNYLCNFIKSGDPNGTDSDGTELPRWESYADSESGMVFTAKAEMEPASSQTELMRFMVDHYIKKNNG